MYAIIEIAGKQYRVEKDATVNVDKINNEGSDNITIDKVLLYSNGDDVMIGQPYLTNVSVDATLIGNFRGAKVRGIKFKKRKNYTRTIGHRRDLTQLKINNLVVS